MDSSLCLCISVDRVHTEEEEGDGHCRVGPQGRGGASPLAQTTWPGHGFACRSLCVGRPRPSSVRNRGRAEEREGEREEEEGARPSRGSSREREGHPAGGSRDKGAEEGRGRAR